MAATNPVWSITLSTGEAVRDAASCEAIGERLGGARGRLHQVGGETSNEFRLGVATGCVNRPFFGASLSDPRTWQVGVHTETSVLGYEYAHQTRGRASCRLVTFEHEVELTEVEVTIEVLERRGEIADYPTFVTPPARGHVTQPAPPRDLSVRLRNHYPAAAVAAGMGGEALARVALSETGEVLLVRIKTRTDTMFADACEAMLLETRWEPARRAGREISIVVDFRCTFEVANASRPPMELVRDVIREHAPEIAICHGPVADILEGEVVVEWLTERDGSVRRARIVSSPVEDASFERCLLTAWRTWHFPESSMEEVVVYSLRFGY